MLSLTKGESMPRHSPYVIKLSAHERSVLERQAAKYTASYRDVVRAKIVLMAAAGMQNKDIAARLSLPVQIVFKWRKRFFEQRLQGLQERPRGGRPPVFSPRSGG
jgi:transposase